MAKKGKKKGLRTLLVIVGGVIVVVAAVVYYFLFSSMTGKDKPQYVFIDSDDNIDSIYVKVQKESRSHPMKAFRWLCSMSSYPEHIKVGKYALEPDYGAYDVFVRMKSGDQATVHLYIPSVRTTERLAELIAKRMLFSKDDILAELDNPTACKKYGFDTATVMCMFIPNTYDIYWDNTAQQFLERMKKESDRFWKGEREEQAKKIGLTPIEVITLASIVNEETAKVDEMPKVAGLYMNRLHKDMLLQADPTVKFAHKNFGAKRIYKRMLTIDNPYNTYKYKGLPPGPIRNPEQAAIDAVLNYTHHDYLYMCAKEDFSGYHNFATTFAEHERNADRYAKALNERGIK